VCRQLSFAILICVLAFTPAVGQEAQRPTRLLTLDDALALAEARSERMAIARAGVQRAEGEQTRAASDLFPHLSAFASYDRALASEFSGLFQNSGQPCAPFIADPLGSVQERLSELERAVDCGASGPVDGNDGFEDLPFGRRNTYRFNLSFSQNLYSGGRIGAQMAIARGALDTAEIALSSARAQLRLDVVSAYYDVALTGRLLEIAEATYEQADATYRETSLGYRAGSQPEFEVLRARVARDNQRPAVIRRGADRDIAMLRLKQLIEVPADEPITLTAPLDGSNLAPPAAFAANLRPALNLPPPESPRAPVREAQAALDLRTASADAARAQRLPSITLTSSYGEVAYPSDGLPAFADFRRNWTVGVLFEVPILTGGRLSAEQAMARADVLEADARLQQARELARLDTLSSYEELRAATAQWEASTGTVQQATRAYEIAELRYREGVSTQLELSDSRLLLAQAQATRALAARDLQVARARVALLPDLPLESSPSIATPLVDAPMPQAPAAPLQPLVTRPASRIGAGSRAPGGPR
jgi:outer membrane protein TolC